MTVYRPTVLISFRKSLSLFGEPSGHGATITVRTEATVSVLTVSGEIDAANAGDFSATLNRFTAAGCRLVVDLRGLEFLGVQGLRTLIQFDEQCRSSAASVLVDGPTVHRLLDVIGCEHRLRTADSVAEATRRLRSATPQAPLLW